MIGPRARRALPPILLAASVSMAVYAVVLLRTAWISDDAYISLRAVDNLFNGYGLRWNINERVQVFTHPLWLFLMMAVTFVTREFFLTPIFASMAVSLAAVYLLMYRVARPTGWTLVAIAAAIASRSFVDYSTSGLENPLTYLLLAVFAILYFGWQWSPGRLAAMAFVGGLIVLNRMDCILLVGPALFYAWLGDRRWRTTLCMAAALTPFAAWELFSIVYYGFPFPNTAYAKLGSGVSQSALAGQAMKYYRYTALRDPATLPAIALCTLAPFVFRQGRERFLALGIGLYLLYIVRIGGDFMAGRFFSAPFFLALILMVRIPLRIGPVMAVPLMAAIAWLAMLAPNAPFLTTAKYGAGRNAFIDGIADERAYYFQGNGLVRWRRNAEFPGHDFARRGREYARAGAEIDKVHGAVGMTAFLAGPKAHIIDYYGLADPLSARLPAQYSPAWRIGHFGRVLPPGYHETSSTGVNSVRDPRLKEYVDHLLLVTRGPLWSAARWRALIAMNLGRYGHLIDWNAYRYYQIQPAELAALPKTRTAGEPWNARGAVAFGSRGLAVALGGMQHAPAVEFSLPDQYDYNLLFLRGGELLGEYTLHRAERMTRRLAVYEAGVPRGIARGGYDAVYIFPWDRRARDHALGHMRLIDGTPSAE